MLLLHGGPGAACDYMLPLAERLAEHREVVILEVTVTQGTVIVEKNEGQTNEEKRQQELQRFAQLFSTAYLDFGVLKHITIEERDVLLAVIDGCLGDSRRQYRAPDGSVIVLLNPDEQTYTALRASDGMLLLPRYRLQREELQGGAA